MRRFILVCSVVAALSACGESDKTTVEASRTSEQVASAPAALPASAARGLLADDAAPTVWAHLTPDNFHSRFDELAKADGDDTIKRMTRGKDGIAVKLNDQRFQTGISMLKKANLANGRFVNQLALQLGVDPSGNITRITVMGVRSDPVNLMHFLGTVGIVNNILNPGQDEKTNLEFLTTLKMMRGDSDETIGQPVVSFNSGGAFKCISFPSDQSTEVGCVIEPRS
jgi:hypothetical protein